MNNADRKTALSNVMNAAGDTAARSWVVRGGYQAGDTGRVLQSGLTYRQASAVAKLMRSSGAYAQAERAQV